MSDIRFVKFGGVYVDVFREDELLGTIEACFNGLKSECLFDDMTAQDLRAIADELDRRNGVKDAD